MGGTKQGHKGEAWSGEGDIGVSRMTASRRHPDGSSRPMVEGKGSKGYREEAAGHRATCKCSGPVVSPPTAGVLTKWGKRASETAELPGDQRSPGLGRLEPSMGPGNQYLDKRLHLQVEFDNLLVTDPDVDILGSRHVGDADYRQRRWPSLNAFRPRGLAAAPPIGQSETSESGGAESWGLVLDTGVGGGSASFLGVILIKRRGRGTIKNAFAVASPPSSADLPCNGYGPFFCIGRKKKKKTGKKVSTGMSLEGGVNNFLIFI